MTTNARQSSSWSFAAIGTSWTIDTAEPIDGALRERIAARIEQFDRTWSRFRPDSLVTAIASAPSGGSFSFPDEAPELFQLYDRLFTATDGALDPLIGRPLELLGYDATYSLTPAPAPARQEWNRQRPTWDSAVQRHGRTVTTRQPLLIDVGAAGKGVLVDLVAELLEDAGLHDHVVDAGGDMRQSGPRGIRVGLEDPFDHRLVIGSTVLHDRSLCASATNRRAWGAGLHHVLDARTGAPTDAIAATWVLAGDTALTDGLATALFLAEPSDLAREFDFSYVRLRVDGQADTSPDLRGVLFSAPPPVAGAGG